MRFAIFSGDVNQDGAVDAGDASMIDNDASNFVSGYVVTDLNGDYTVDGSDMLLVEFNASNYVAKSVP